MKEKVLCVELPEDTIDRRAEKTGRSNTVYPKKVRIPKPEPLLGGSKVYQIEDEEIPYWYCNIKNGRDAFMHVYMEDLSKKDLLYDPKTGQKRTFVTDNEKKFKKDVLQALDNKPKEGYRWIPVYEPSIGNSGFLQFVAGEKVVTLREVLDSKKSIHSFEEYSPENESTIASKTTYYLLLLRWLKDGIATLAQLVDDSRRIGHYFDTSDASLQVEVAGTRKFGGLYGFVGNTFKLVANPDVECGYSLQGGSFFEYGYENPVAHEQICNISFMVLRRITILIELRK